VQTDWNQNNDTAADFLKNKPFYEEIVKITLFERETIPFENMEGTYGAYLPADFGKISNGDIFQITWDDKTFEVAAMDITELMFGIPSTNGLFVMVVGNQAYIGGEDDGLPFVAFFQDLTAFEGEKMASIAAITSTEAEHTIKIVQHQRNIIQIPEKYIPKLDYALPEDLLKYQLVENAVGVRVENGGEKFNAANEASGLNSHAEGESTVASGRNSHAEGYQTQATQSYAHAEGQGTSAKGLASHSEGTDTQALSSGSHAEGLNTVAVSDYQHVQGRWNISDAKNKYAHIVGNGTFGNASNAHTLDWDGNAWFAGGIELTSPNGTRYRFTVSDDGTLTATTVAE
jgi:hypothetical protein